MLGYKHSCGRFIVKWRCSQCNVTYPESEINGHVCPVDQHDEAKELWPHVWDEEELSENGDDDDPRAA